MIIRILGVFSIAAIGWVLLAMLTVASVRANECEVEPASEWAPQGFICPPHYGDGDASMWGGLGVAVNSCVYPWTACPPIRITSHVTGVSIVVTPVMWCHCWVNLTGPNGETERLVDLDPAAVAALGLDPDVPTLHRVQVEPASMLPDTAMQP